MKRGKKQPELFEILQASGSGPPGDAGGSKVESLANSMATDEPPRSTGARTFSMRYDTALVLLVIVLVMMVVSYVLGVSVAQNRQEQVPSMEPVESPQPVPDVWVVQVMSGSTVNAEIIERYKAAKRILEERMFKNVEVHAGRNSIYLTVGRFEDRNDSKWPSLMRDLKNLVLDDRSVLDPVPRRLRAIKQVIQ